MSPADNYPLISIIMPTYNRAGYIDETIQSIRKQTYQHWELLIMDDGSVDSTRQVVAGAQASDARIGYHHYENTAITGTLKNNGIALAKGTLIAFMDSDDLWPPEKLSEQLGALQQHPDAGFSFTNGYNFNSSDGSISTYIIEKTSGIKFGDFLEPICSGQIGVNIQTVMVWKRLLGRNHLFRTGRTFTDFSFIANLAEQYKAVLLYEPLFQRRLHDQNASAIGWIDDYEEHLETVTRLHAEGKLPSAEAHKILSKVYIHFGEELIQRGRSKEACIAFWNAWKHNQTSFIPFRKMAKAMLKR